MSTGGTKRGQSRSFKTQIIKRLDVLRIGPRDVLVLRLPAEVLEDPIQNKKAHDAARDIAEVAKRGIVILEEGAPLSAETVKGSFLPTPIVHQPPRSEVVGRPRVGLRE